MIVLKRIKGLLKKMTSDVIDPEKETVIWFNTETRELNSGDPPITNQEILEWIGKFVDHEVFEIRNLNSRRTEAEAQRIRKRYEYLKERLLSD